MTPQEPELACADLPAVGGRIGPEPEDFVVDEVLDREPSGSGEHLFVNPNASGLGALVLGDGVSGGQVHGQACFASKASVLMSMIDCTVSPRIESLAQR